MDGADRRLQRALGEIERLRARCEALERQHIERDELPKITGQGSKAWGELAWELVSYCLSGDWRQGSARLLRAGLECTRSEYGFVGVVVEQGTLRILAHEGVVWHQTTNRAFYEGAMKTYREVGYLEFTSLDNLFGEVVRTGKPVRSNDAAHDLRAKKSLPPGHPPLRQFLGVPAYHQNEVVGMIGVANREGGYGQQQEDDLRALAEVIAPFYENYGLHLRDIVLMEEVQQSQGRVLRVLEERENVALYLYDKCLQLTYSAGLAIDQWSHVARQYGDSNQVHAKRLIDAFNGFIDEIRTYLLGSSKASGECTIEDHLVQLVERMKGIHGLSYTIAVDPDVARSLSLETTCQLLFVVQTAISTIRRHAKSTAVGIELCRTGQQARLKIVDNGIGLTSETQGAYNRSLGEMQKRAGLINGTVAMTAQPGQGVEVVIAVPVHPPPLPLSHR